MTTTETMNAKSVTPHFLTTKVDEAKEFYSRHLGFRATFHKPGEYVSMRSREPSGTEVAFMAPPPGAPVPAAEGIFYGIEVADADREHTRLVAEGVKIVDAPEDQPWGGRRLTFRDPSGILVLLFHPIPLDAEFEQYVVH